MISLSKASSVMAMTVCWNLIWLAHINWQNDKVGAYNPTTPKLFLKDKK
jgi:hypothetical protein